MFTMPGDRAGRKRARATSGGSGTVSGTTNTMAKFTAPTVVGDSNQTDDGTTFTVGKRTAFPQGTYTFNTAAANNNVSLGDYTTILAGLDVATAASGNITGITNGSNGRILIIQSTITTAQGGYLIFTDEDAASTAANRFRLVTANVLVLPDSSIMFVYDSSISRWRQVRDGVAGSGFVGQLTVWGSSSGLAIGDPTQEIGGVNKLGYYDGVTVTGKGVVPIHDVVSLPGQSGDIGTTTFPSVDDGLGGGTASGLFRVSVYVASASGALAASTVKGRITWRDGIGLRTQDTSTVNLVTSAQTNQTFFIYAGTAGGMGVGPITYETVTTGIPVTESFDFFATLEKLSD